MSKERTFTREQIRRLRNKPGYSGVCLWTRGGRTEVWWRGTRLGIVVDEKPGFYDGGAQK